MIKQGRVSLLCQISIPLILALLVFLTGCGTTKPSRFYTLNSLKAQDTTAQQTISSDGNISIGIGSVNIPDYLDRPQIVSHTSQNELSVDEFNRWAGSLDNDIARVLSEDLSILLSEEHVSVLTWERVVPVDYRIVVHVSRFDVMPDDTVLLKSQWSVFGRDGKNVLIRESKFSEHIDGKEYGARVATMSRVVEMLSRDIVEAVKQLIQSGGK